MKSFESRGGCADAFMSMAERVAGKKKNCDLDVLDDFEREAWEHADRSRETTRVVHIDRGYVFPSHEHR